MGDFSSQPIQSVGEIGIVDPTSSAELAHKLHAQAVTVFSQKSPPTHESARLALDFLKQSVAILPNSQSLLNTAKICMVLNEHRNAIHWGQQCLQFCASNSNEQTNSLQAHRLLGQAYAHLANYADALPHLEIFHQQVPNDMANEFDLSYSLLAMGNFDKGWHHYQVRYRTGFAVSGAQELNKIPAAQWQGDLSELKGKVILLMPEQGFGDEIHFSRVARHLKTAGARVWIMSPQPLESLMRTLPWKERIVSTQWQAYSEIDFWSTAIRACAYLKLNPYLEPPICPYLMADPAQLDKFSDLLTLSQSTDLIGINWRGNAKHFNDTARSMSLQEMLEEVSALNAKPTPQRRTVKLCSFQLGPTPSESSLMNERNILDLSSRIQDFSQMAAALSLMNSFVTIDSAPAHLAGALKVQTSLLVPPRIDWRWGTQGKRPPWYTGLNVKLQNRFK